MTETAEAPRQKPAKYQEWLDRLPRFARRTQKGTVFCLKINVNQRGHGYILHMTEGGPKDNANNAKVVDNVEQAMEVLRELWVRAHEMANSPDAVGDTGRDG
jgi:hypothetical protein